MSKFPRVKISAKEPITGHKRQSKKKKKKVALFSAGVLFFIYFFHLSSSPSFWKQERENMELAFNTEMKSTGLPRFRTSVPECIYWPWKHLQKTTTCWAEVEKGRRKALCACSVVVTANLKFCPCLWKPNGFQASSLGEAPTPTSTLLTCSNRQLLIKDFSTRDLLLFLQSMERGEGKGLQEGTARCFQPRKPKYTRQQDSYCCRQCKKKIKVAL